MTFTLHYIFCTLYTYAVSQFTDQICSRKVTCGTKLVIYNLKDGKRMCFLKESSGEYF